MRTPFVHEKCIESISLANPWLDFLSEQEATSMATLLNRDLHNACDSDRLYAFGVLPNTPDAMCTELEHISTLSKMKGVILGTYGVGKGLDDPAMVPVFQKAASLGLMLFIHPHYGIGPAYGSQETGHVLPLSLGFPFETTIVCELFLL